MYASFKYIIYTYVPLAYYLSYTVLCKRYNNISTTAFDFIRLYCIRTSSRCDLSSSGAEINTVPGLCGKGTKK